MFTRQLLRPPSRHVNLSVHWLMIRELLVIGLLSAAVPMGHIAGLVRSSVLRLYGQWRRSQEAGGGKFLDFGPWFIPHPTGHIGPHSVASRVCQELPPLLLPRWTPSFVSLCWLCFSSSLLVDLVLSYILAPANTVLAVVCADGLYAEHVQAIEIVFLSVCCAWLVVRFWFWPQCLLSWLSKRCPVCSSAICDVPHPVSFLMLPPLNFGLS